MTKNKIFSMRDMVGIYFNYRFRVFCVVEQACKFFYWFGVFEFGTIVAKSTCGDSALQWSVSVIRRVLFLLWFLACNAKAGIYGDEKWGEMYWGDNPATVPMSAPTIASAVASEDQITVTLSDFPTGTGADGWSAVTSFTVTCGELSTVVSGNEVTITGLDEDTAYSCTVTANNAVGSGPEVIKVVTTAAALKGMNFILICTAIDCGSRTT
jgi:hypothetical protein